MSIESPDRRSAIESVLDLIYPPKCGLCGLLNSEAICSVCRSAFSELPLALVDGPPGLSLDGIAAPFRYEGRAEQAIKRLKYGRVTSLAGPMSSLLCEFARATGQLEHDGFVVVPIHWTRRCERGFNQSELLARALPSERVLNGALRRVRATRPQVGLNSEARRQNVLGAFRAEGHFGGMSIALLDDVITTGHTAQECAGVLKRAGASRVIALAFASGGALEPSPIDWVDD